MRITCLLRFVMLLGTLSVTTMCAGTPGVPVNGQTQAPGAGRQQSAPVRDINSFVRQRYPGCRILDKDTDDGLLEVKIRHQGVEKILLFDEGRWLRTLWELRRSSLPERVLSAFRRAGFRYENIDDNDNMAVDTPNGRFYAVQAKRNDREYIYVVSRNGDFARRYTSDGWDDGRLHGGGWSGSPGAGGEDRFDEGDDEWDCCNDRRHHRRHYRHYDDGEDRFDEGDDEWDNRRSRPRDDGEDRFDEGDDEWPGGEA